VLGEKLSASLGQPIVVENRGGAGGVLGTEIVAKAVPDGYTLLLVPTSHVINPSIYAKLPYDTAKDFAPITMVASAPILMALNPRVPAETVSGFVEAAKASPKAIGNYGSAGVGTVFHLTGQLFNQLSGLSLQHVPYRGGGPTVTALLAGEVPLAFETMLSLQPHVRAGSLRALAITSPRRSTTMPEIPTTADAGFPELVAENSYALFAPAKTPVPILTRLQMPPSRHSHCRMSAIGCTSRAPRSSVTVQPTLPPMLPPRFQNGRHWHARRVSSPNDSNGISNVRFGSKADMTL
jgi:tripartite-type tricarboxylate transporter receptor subunit TctC